MSAVSVSAKNVEPGGPLVLLYSDDLTATEQTSARTYIRRVRGISISVSGFLWAEKYRVGSG
jgi:hypothetical protein